jgi:deazaflavin-dependent oxidoreductase (nitroreductase family)
LMSIRYGTAYIVLASNAGAPHHPDWFHNLIAHPHVMVEVKEATFTTDAIVATGAEREQIWAHVLAVAPFFAEHQAKIARQIPVIILQQTEADQDD